MKLGLVIDIDACVGCHACATACKQWNGQSLMAGGAPDYDPYGAEPSGVWFNRIRHYEVGDYPASKTLNVPLSCMHCTSADCVTVCPTGASYKRAEDGIVLIDPERCMGCNYCAWACPYGARELDEQEGVMRKCTLCVDRIYDQALPEAERQPACVLSCPTHARHFGDFDDPGSKVSELVRARNGQALMPALGYEPVNRYLPPRPVPKIPIKMERLESVQGVQGVQSGQGVQGLHGGQVVDSAGSAAQARAEAAGSRPDLARTPLPAAGSLRDRVARFVNRVISL